MKRVADRVEYGCSIGAPIVLLGGLAQLPDYRGWVASSSSGAGLAAVRDDETVSGAEHRLQECMPVVVSPVSITWMVCAAGQVEARTIVGARKGVLPQTHQAHDPKRYRAQRHQVAHGDAALQITHGGGVVAEHRAQLPPDGLECDPSLVGGAIGALSKRVEGHPNVPQARRALVAFVEQCAG